TASINFSSLSTDPPAGDAIIPAAAQAGFDLRCPPSLDPADFIADLRKTVDAKALAGVEIDVFDSYPGCRFSRRSAGVEALLAAYRETAAPPQVWPWAIGAAPGYAFKRHTPCFLIGGAGRGGNAHGIDEFMTLEGY